MAASKTSYEFTKLTLDSTIHDFREKFKTDKAFQMHCMTLRDRSKEPIKFTSIKNPKDIQEVELWWKAESTFVITTLLGRILKHADAIIKKGNFRGAGADGLQWFQPLESSKFTGYQSLQFQSANNNDRNRDYYNKFYTTVDAALGAFYKNEFPNESIEKITLGQLCNELANLLARLQDKMDPESPYRIFMTDPNPLTFAARFKYVLEQLILPTAQELAIDLIAKGEAKQIVFTGAPGSGKTYVAKEIPLHFYKLGKAGLITLESEKKLNKTPQPYVQVQFHPSYDYTDFVEGLRPVQLQGSESMSFCKIDGKFKEFCRKVVEQNQDHFPTTLTEVKNHANTVVACLKLNDFASASGAAKSLSQKLSNNKIKTEAETLFVSIDHAKFAHTCLQSQLTADEIQTLLEEGNNLLNLGGNNSEFEKLVAALSDCQSIYMNDSIDLAARLTANLLYLDAQSEQYTRLKEFLKDFAPKDTESSQQNPSSDFATQLVNAAKMHAQQVIEQTAEAATALYHKLNAFTRGEDIVKPDLPYYFFIIDEINRANLSKVFGELMYGLEKDKRGKQHAIHTQYQNLPTYQIVYGDQAAKDDGNAPAAGTQAGMMYATPLPEQDDVFFNGFYIPENVVVIGTMNDIDRSVDSMDFALRRRFEWIEFKVTQESLLQAFESEQSYGPVISRLADTLAKYVNNLNLYIEKDGAASGLNRQYFIGQGQFANLPRNLTHTEVSSWNQTETDAKLDPILRYVWDYRIESLLREYLRGRDESDIQTFIDGAKAAFIPSVKAAATKAGRKPGKTTQNAKTTSDKD